MELWMSVVLISLCILFAGVLVLDEFRRKRKHNGRDPCTFASKLDKSLVVTRSEVRRLEALHESWVHDSTTQVIGRNVKNKSVNNKQIVLEASSTDFDQRY